MNPGLGGRLEAAQALSQIFGTCVGHVAQSGLEDSEKKLYTCENCGVVFQINEQK